MEERTVTVEGETMPLAAPVPRAGDREPDRARRHVSAAGGPTRPLPAPDRRRLSKRKRMKIEMLDRLQGGSLLDQLRDVDLAGALVEAGQKTRDVFVAPDLKALHCRDRARDARA